VIGENDLLGLANRFKVTVGGCDLGSWAKCDGLKVSLETEKRESGGEYDKLYILPKQVKWGTISLTRAMTAKDSPALYSWLKGKIGEYNHIAGNLGYIDGDATITLLDAQGNGVITWAFRGVHVDSWKGPSLDASSSKIALETLTLIHEGFA
jgi:phage tail-like protein